MTLNAHYNEELKLCLVLVKEKKFYNCKQFRTVHYK